MAKHLCDLHGAALTKAIKKSCPSVTIFGMGGSKMKEAGVEIVHDINKLTAMGIVEVKRSSCTDLHIRHPFSKGDL
ncbi:hypothetical protein [Sporomusa aerivorans]|uniref:hypothetical protein n=1 Tax=Sporomusa aerivorans TaxID=204936 RepID=UPI00352AE77A